MQTGTQTYTVTIPANAQCSMASPARCRFLMIMTDHVFPTCNYHHCANMALAGSATGSGGATGADAGTSGQGGAAAGTGGKTGAGGSTTTGAGGATTGGGGATAGEGGTTGGGSGGAMAGEGGATGGGQDCGSDGGAGSSGNGCGCAVGGGLGGPRAASSSWHSSRYAVAVAGTDSHPRRQPSRLERQEEDPVHERVCVGCANRRYAGLGSVPAFCPGRRAIYQRQHTVCGPVGVYPPEGIACGAPQTPGVGLPARAGKSSEATQPDGLLTAGLVPSPLNWPASNVPDPAPAGSQTPYPTVIKVPVQLSPEAIPHPRHVQPAPAAVAPVAQLPLAPIAVNPAGQGWVPVASRQIFVAAGAHCPAGHVAASEGSGQKFMDVCQTGSGAVAPVGSQFGQTLPSQGQDVASEQALNDAG